MNRPCASQEWEIITAIRLILQEGDDGNDDEDKKDKTDTETYQQIQQLAREGIPDAQLDGKT